MQSKEKLNHIMLVLSGFKSMCKTPRQTLSVNKAIKYTEELSCKQKHKVL